jgi:hypothetical protein
MASYEIYNPGVIPAFGFQLNGGLAYELWLFQSVVTQPAPQVTNLSPAAGTPIGSTQPILFHVTDFQVDGITPVPMDIVYIKASYPSLGIEEIVYDEDGFGQSFGGSVANAISGGFAFTVLRTGGWLDQQVEISVVAVNNTGVQL